MTEYFNAPHDSSFNDQRALHNSLHGRSSYNPYPNGVPLAARESLAPQYPSPYRPPRGQVTYGNVVPEVRRVTRNLSQDDSFRSPPRGPGMPMSSPMPGAARFREHDQVSPTRLNSGPTHVEYPQDTMPTHPEPSWIPMSPQDDSRHLSFFPPQASTPAPDGVRYGDTPRYQPQEMSNFGDDSRYPEQGSQYVDQSMRYGRENLDETVQSMADEFDGSGGPYDDEGIEEMDVQPVGVDQSYGESAHIPGEMPMSTPYYSEPPHSVATHDIPQAVDLHDIPKPDKGKKKFVGGWIWGLFPKKSSSKSATSQARPAQPIPIPIPTQIPSQSTPPPQLRPYVQSPGRIPNSTNRLPHQSPHPDPNYPSGEAAAYQPPRNATRSLNETRPLSPGRSSQHSHGSRPSRPQGSHRSDTFSGSSGGGPYSHDQSAEPVGDAANNEHLPNPFDINPHPEALTSPKAIHLQHAEDYDAMSDPYVATRADTTFSSRVNRVGSFLSGLFHLPWMSAHVSVEYRPSDSRRARYDKPKKSWYSKEGHKKLDLLAAPPTPISTRIPTELARDRERARERREQERRQRARSAPRDAQREREHRQRSRSAPARTRSPGSNTSSGHARGATAGRPVRTFANLPAHDGTTVFASPGASTHGLVSTSYVYPALWVVPPGAQIGSPQMQGQDQSAKLDAASPQAGQLQSNMPPSSRGPSPMIVGPNVPYVVIGAGPWPLSSGSASPPSRRQSPRQRSTQRRAARMGSSESPPPPMPVPSTSARRLSMRG